MKMHFCIPVSQQRPDALGGRYVLYSVYLDGFLFCKVRYSQLHRWNEQLRRVFGNCLPPFPPKYYLAMTASMADERRDQLEQYLQNVTMDPNMLRSDVFVDFLKLVQLDTFSITTKKASLDIFLPDGRSIKVEILTSDTAERVLEAIQDIEKEWAKPTEVQRQKLEALQKEDNQTKFLELSQEVWHYGYVQLDPCTCDYPEPGCGTVLSVGNNEISCCITLPDNQTQDVIFQMNRVKCWQVTFLGTLLDTDGPQQTLNQNLELRFQYSEDSHWQWFVIYTKQAFLLSSCLKKMISEKMVKQAAENPEMQIEVPEQGKSKKHHSQQSQKDYSSFLPRKSKIKTAEVDCGLGTIKEEGL
ncbi:sorting nexin-31 isoform X5 [Balaenoptera ricei]|uniref:sorting nexin-31 isoform X5 n=1 Tax=Balaenoptera ricei TaxID=2746895 RepID=UPI0028BD591B|nr:sorting nexin-31 isoform X5 [Balaenoptera ricei]